MVDILTDNKSILHVDESDFNSDNYGCYSWCRKSDHSTVRINKSFANYTLVFAVSTCGRAWSCILQGTNNNLTWRRIVYNLVCTLDDEIPDW